MAKRDNHYEAAFEAWLRSRKIPYLAVDETKRSLAEGRSLKNLDFVVSPPALSHSWLVDVKGRRFPTGKSYWKNWVTAEELQSLASWERLFGERFSGLLVFAYNVVGDHAPLPADELFAFRGGLYGFVGIRLDHYASWAKTLSPRWGTVSVPTDKFRSLAQGVDEMLRGTRHARQGVA
ncbi:MAG: HYExAFE family protein [Planctomycetales bacterium]|nr:HYExAFE family protein [Planctomycetales bacterium]